MAVSIVDAAGATPPERQLAWQRMEFYAFIHFSINTFTGSEWGTELESPSLFDPSELDARQMTDNAKDENEAAGANRQLHSVNGRKRY